jgi:hypothetical protein
MICSFGQHQNSPSRQLTHSPSIEIPPSGRLADVDENEESDGTSSDGHETASGHQKRMQDRSRNLKRKRNLNSEEQEEEDDEEENEGNEGLQLKLCAFI